MGSFEGGAVDRRRAAGGVHPAALPLAARLPLCQCGEMGHDTSSVTWERSERTSYRLKMRENLETFARYLPRAEFEDAGTIGVEMELNLVDDAGLPVRAAQQVLAAIGADGSEDFQTEIGAHNVEFNVPVFSVKGHGLTDVEESICARLDRAQAAVSADPAARGVHLLPIGMLPTLSEADLRRSDWRIPENRYHALDTAVLEARGEDVHIHVQGVEDIDLMFPSISPESACTSVQLHLQVPPSRFAPAWNAAQAIAGPQVALAANSPFFAGHSAWAENRIPVFTQAVDTRPPEYASQGVRPRVWFGERWINSMFDLLEENVRYFPAILPESREEAGEPLMTKGAAPMLHELVLHNGTVWRWNRPIYDPGTGGRPHLRIENRLLPAGPTVGDQIADAAFFYGLVTRLSRSVRPLWSRMPFADAEANFFACAQDGLDAEVVWPGYGRMPVTELISTELVPLATQGLVMLDVDAGLVERYMGVIDARARAGQNGASWQRAVVRSLEGHGLDRAAALAEMTRRYRGLQESGRPVHTWGV